MKRFLLALFLLATAAPLFANDEGGDPGYIPDYQELLREGYGPRDYDRDRDREDYYLRLGFGYATVPKPTQAYYGKGYVIYYGYTVVPVWHWEARELYAFGHPVEYFRHLMPGATGNVDLSNYAVEVRNSNYGPGDYVAQNQAHHGDAVTTVQSVTKTATTASAAAKGTNTLPAIGEKPAH
jgi:hypothetical protein